MPLQLPVGGSGPPHEPPPYGGLGPDGWARGRTFLELVESAGTAAAAALAAAFAATEVEETRRAFFSAYPRPVRVLALADLGCTDSVTNVGQAERLFTLGQHIWMRIFLAEEHADVRQLFASPELPLLVFFGADKREFGRWGPRPHALLDAEGNVAPAARVAFRDDFYARNRGRDLAAELVARLAAHTDPGAA